MSDIRANLWFSLTIHMIFCFVVFSFLSCQQCEAMKKFIEERKTLSPDMRRFAISLVNNELPLLRTGPGDNSLEGTVIEMAIHVATILLCGQSKVLEPLKNLAFSPELMVVRLGCDCICVHRKNFRDPAGTSETVEPVYLLDSPSASVSLDPLVHNDGEKLALPFVISQGAVLCSS